MRTLPLPSTLLLGAFWAVFLSAMLSGDFLALGVRSWLTMSIMLLSVVFGLTAAASLYVVYDARSEAMNRIAYWHSVLVASVLAAVAIAISYWGFIGLSLWA